MLLSSEVVADLYPHCHSKEMIRNLKSTEDLTSGLAKDRLLTVYGLTLSQLDLFVLPMKQQSQTHHAAAELEARKHKLSADVQPFFSYSERSCSISHKTQLKNTIKNTCSL